MPPAGFEPAIPTNELPQAHALHRAATWIVAPCSMVYIPPFPKNILFAASAFKMEAACATKTLVPF